VYRDWCVQSHYLCSYGVVALFTASLETTAASSGDILAVRIASAPATSMPTVAFAQSAPLTCNFTAYPWVGDAGSLLTSASGIALPDERLTPLLVLNDKNGTYGAAFAVFNATAGNNSTATTWVYSTQATADAAYASWTANSYITIGNAVQAIKGYHNRMRRARRLGRLGITSGRLVIIV
jgi:hypothetical protein